MPYPADNLYPPFFPGGPNPLDTPAPAPFVQEQEKINVPWRSILVDSKDMTRLGELSLASDFSLDVLLNLPGSLNINYPMDADYADLIRPYRTGIITERFNWRATEARRELGLYGEVWDKIWSGYILPIDEDWKNSTMKISCVGWMQRLAKRISRAKLIYDDIDDGVIILALLQHVNGLTGTTAGHTAGTNSFVMADGYTIKWPLGSTPNTSTWMKYGGTLPNEGVGGATAYTTQVRDVTVEKYSEILPVIQNLINYENGCDVVVDPSTRAVSIHRKYSRDLSDEIFLGFRWGPENIADFNRQIDAEQKVNYILARGAPSVAGQYADDDADMEEYGPIEEVANIGNVTSANNLLAYAGAELLVRGNGVITYGISPFVYSPASGVPEPFVDYHIGDFLGLVAKHPVRGSISGGGVRVFGMKVTLDKNGNEKLGQLQISP